MKHWINNYIGLPWLIGGTDILEGTDCWGFFRYIQKKYYKINLPIIKVSNNFKDILYEFKTNKEKENWQETNIPDDGDGVLMRLNRYPNHVGIWIKTNEFRGVLHCVEKTGVIFTDIYNIHSSKWRILSYYKYIGNL